MPIALLSKQKLFLVVSILIEAYRVCMGSLLVIFVPQTCGNHRCNMFENLMIGDTVYRAAAICNFTTLIFFCILYSIEVRRENRLNNYLIVNPLLPTDTESVESRVSYLSDERRLRLISLNTTYKRICYATFCMFIINTIFSAYIMGFQYYDDKAPMIFITNTILIGSKLYDIIYILKTQQSAFISAYVKQKCHFNDVHPNKYTDARLAVL